MNRLLKTISVATLVFHGGFIGALRAEDHDGEISGGARPAPVQLSVKQKNDVLQSKMKAFLSTNELPFGLRRTLTTCVNKGRFEEVNHGLEMLMAKIVKLNTGLPLHRIPLDNNYQDLVFFLRSMSNPINFQSSLKYLERINIGFRTSPYVLEGTSYDYDMFDKHLDEETQDKFRNIVLAHPLFEGAYELFDNDAIYNLFLVLSKKENLKDELDNIQNYITQNNINKKHFLIVCSFLDCNKNESITSIFDKAGKFLEAGDFNDNTLYALLNFFRTKWTKKFPILKNKGVDDLMTVFSMINKNKSGLKYVDQISAIRISENLGTNHSNEWWDGVCRLSDLLTLNNFSETEFSNLMTPRKAERKAVYNISYEWWKEVFLLDTFDKFRRKSELRKAILRLAEYTNFTKEHFESFVKINGLAENLGDRLFISFSKGSQSYLNKAIRVAFSASDVTQVEIINLIIQANVNGRSFGDKLDSIETAINNRAPAEVLGIVRAIFGENAAAQQQLRVVDFQSVHTTARNSGTKESIEVLMGILTPDPDDYLNSIAEVLKLVKTLQEDPLHSFHPKQTRLYGLESKFESIKQVIAGPINRFAPILLNETYKGKDGRDVSVQDVFTRVWQIVKNTVSNGNKDYVLTGREELVHSFLNFLSEMRDEGTRQIGLHTVCQDGKIQRLLTVLQGVVPGIRIDEQVPLLDAPAPIPGLTSPQHAQREANTALGFVSQSILGLIQDKSLGTVDLIEKKIEEIKGDLLIKFAFETPFYVEYANAVNDGLSALKESAIDLLDEILARESEGKKSKTN